MKKFRVFIAFCLVLASLDASAQNARYLSYIDTYKDMAVDQMRRYGIPASITLAQGLLESSAGTSYLAVRANNHFGIKTGGTWTGPYVLRDDDAKNEQFRKYRSVAESYEDHSLFLKNRPRYASLFKLSPTDYKGWAHGLKAAGYATNPQYAYKLISLIDTYSLHQYDRQKGHHTEKQPQRAESGKRHAGPADALHRCNYAYYIVARQGDTYAAIARRMGVSERRLRKYNEVGKGYTPKAGDPVYVSKKSSRVMRSMRKKVHVVRAGESLHAIAQSYGVRIGRLYKANRLPADYLPRVGDRLKLN